MGEHLLDDGTRIALRGITPEDAAELRRGFARLSPRSRQRRFFSVVGDLSTETLRYLTEVDGEDHVGIVATKDSLDLKTEIGVGVARFIRLKEDPEVAEAAVTIADGMQHKGAGRLLLRELARVARTKGVRKFRGEILVSNLPMRRLLESVGAVWASDAAVSSGAPGEQRAHDTLLFEVTIGEEENRRASALERLLGATASAARVFRRTLRLPRA